MSLYNTRAAVTGQYGAELTWPRLLGPQVSTIAAAESDAATIAAVRYDVATIAAVRSDVATIAAVESDVAVV